MMLRNVKWLFAAFIAFGPAPAAARPGELGPVGGIEIGSKGVKPAVLIFRKSADGLDYDIQSQDDKELKEANTELGNLKAGSTTEFDPERFEKTVRAVAAMQARMKQHYKLDGERVRVVVSSGVFSGFAAEAVKPAHEKLSVAIKDATGVEPVFVDAAKETEYAARSTLPAGTRKTSIVVDIGSGNARVGSYGPGFEAISIENGTGRFQREASKQAEASKREFSVVARELRDTLIAKPLREKLAAKPVASERTEAHLVGGAAWALATLTKPAKIADTRVPLSIEDLERFAKLTRMPAAELRTAALESVTDAEVRKSAAAEVDKVLKVFTPEQLQAASEILFAFAEECKFEGKKVYFYRKGQSAWIAGHLAETLGLKE